MMLPLRRLGFVTLAAATAAVAQDRPPTDITLAAQVLAGLADGGETLIGSLGKGKVTASEGGLYEIALASGTAKFLFDAPDTCVFTMHSQMDGQGATDARFDFTRVSGVEVRAQGEWEGLKATLVTIAAPEDAVQVLMNDKWVNQMGVAFLASSLTTEEITAAAEELRRRCPGG